MIRDLLILPGGQEISAGAGATLTIQSLTYSRQVSGSGELDFCCAGAGEIKVKLLDTTGQYAMASGQPVSYYRVGETGERYQMGTFYIQSVTRPGKYTVELVAYDAMLLLEKDLTQWLPEQSWPMTIQQLLEGVCQECGVGLSEAALCNGAVQAPQFHQSVTGRQLVAWVAEANGVFARINEEDTLVLEGLSSGAPIPLTRQKSRKLAQQGCAPVDQVAVCQAVGDVGVVYPDSGTQTYTITANPLLTIPGQSVQNLHTQLQGLTYTPFTAEVFVDTPAPIWQPGQLVQVEDGETTHTCAVFRMELQGNVAKLESWGSANRDSVAGQYSRDTVKILQKQMTKAQLDVEGVSTEVTRVEAEFSQAQAQVREDISALQVASDGVYAQVSQVEKQVQTDLELVEQSLESLKQTAALSLTAQQLELALAREREAGAEKVVTKTGYTFDADGLHIATSRSDIANRLDHQGMLVRRGDEVLLQADPTGVTARDVRVANYLVIGTHARLEDYPGNRTACFWL